MSGDTEEDPVVSWIQNNTTPLESLADSLYAVAFLLIGVSIGIAYSADLTLSQFCTTTRYATASPVCTELSSTLYQFTIGSVVLGGVLLIGSLVTGAATED